MEHDDVMAVEELLRRLDETASDLDVEPDWGFGRVEERVAAVEAKVEKTAELIRLDMKALLASVARLSAELRRATEAMRKSTRARGA